MQTHKHGPSGFPVDTDPGTGSCTAEAHNKHMSATHHAQNCSNHARATTCTGSRPKSGTQLQLQPLARLALQAHGTGPRGHSGTAPAPIVESISSRFSAASRDACNQGKAIATQLWRAGTSPTHCLVGSHQKLHLMHCQRAREDLLD
jgi:hypothetical protein